MYIIFINTILENKIDKCLKIYFLKKAIVSLLHANIKKYLHFFKKESGTVTHFC